MKRQGFLTAVLLGTTATTGWLVARHLQLGAAEEPAGSYREAYASGLVAPSGAAADEGVRLNFFDASWDRALQRVADEFGLTLVMDRIPPGRFARRDRNRYAPDEAIRILNSELERQGFRLLLQGRYLIVLDLDEARTEYARPRLSRPTAGTRPPSQTGVDGGIRNPGRLASRTPAAARSAAAHPAGPDSAPGRGSDAAADRQRQVTTVASTRRTDPPQPDPPTPAPMTVRTIACEQNPATDIARSIYLVFTRRAELQQQGLRGLPTFAVYDEEPAAADRSLLFRIAIDQQRNELIVEAPEPRHRHLARLIAELDQPLDVADESVQLLPNQNLDPDAAAQLNAQIEKLVRLRQTEAQAAGAQAQPPGRGADQPEEAAAAAMADESTPDDSGTLNLRGDVNLQVIPELGIVILRGNQADIDTVTDVINRLEQMSQGTVPSIELLMLTHINSEALAELLTSVYDELEDLRETAGQQNRKSAAFVPVVQPNAVLILSSPLELESILQLADELDQPLDPEFEFEVYPLKNAIASQVMTNLETFYEDRGGLGVRVRVVADVRTNSLIVQGRPVELAEVGQLIEKIDRDDSGAVHRVQIFELKNAVAEELATTINTAIQAVVNPPQQNQQGGLGGGFGGGFGATAQGAQELRDSKSVALEFLSTDGTARELIRSGIMVDVRVNADVRTNTLIVSAPEASMGLMSALIEQLDRPPSAIADVKIFTLQNADAEQSVTLLESLFEAQNQEDELGIQIAGAQDASSSLIPLQFSADIRTNSVLAVGSAEALGVVEAILLRLDTDDTRQRQTTVIPLNNAPAELVADALTRFLEQQAALQDSTADLISNIERLRQEVLVAEDTNTNSLIVSASPEYFSQMTAIIETLDSTPPEVIIQALLVEVVLDATDEFGIELGFQDPLLYSRSLATATGVAAPGLNFNNTSVALGNPSTATSTSGNVGTQGLSNFSLGRQNLDLGFGGFVFSAQSDAVSVLLRALAARRTVHVLSRPQIRTTHNNQALVRVGQEVPVVDGVTITQQGLVQPNVVRQPTGIILQVTPRIRNDGVIAMEVYAEKSALSDSGVPVFIDATTGNTVESPIIDQSIADTTVNVPNNQTIVIGGMITKNDASSERKVPWLGDLPMVGKAFRYDATNIRRTELLIFLTPRIILGDVDSELIKQIESERMHFIESDAEEVHGPLYSVPPQHEAADLMIEPYYPPLDSPDREPPAPGGPTDSLSPDLELLPDAPQANRSWEPAPAPQTAPGPPVRPASDQTSEPKRRWPRLTW